MIYDEESDYDLDPKTAVPQNGKRPWPVRMVTLLLFFEGFVFLGAALYILSDIDFTQYTTIQAYWMQTFPQEIIFILLAIFAFWAGIAFVALWRSGWVIAMVAQGITLAVAITLYLNGFRIFVYVMIVIANFLVIYLHNPDIQTVFKMKKVKPRREEGV